MSRDAFGITTTIKSVPLSGTHTVAFTVTNLLERQVRVNASVVVTMDDRTLDDIEFIQVVEPSIFDLAPDGSATVDVRVDVPGELLADWQSEKASLQFRLVVRNIDDPDDEHGQSVPVILHPGEDRPPPPPPVEKKPPWLLFAVIGGGVLVAGIIAVVIYLAMRGNGTPAPEDAAPPPPPDTSTPDTSAPDASGPRCTVSETLCEDSCVTTQTDKHHCGACNHDCMGGTCTSGECNAVEVRSGKGRLFMVHVDATSIYYGGDGTDVGRVNKDGSNDTILHKNGSTLAAREFCYDSALTPTAVVWGNDWAAPGVRGCDRPDCPGGVKQYVTGSNLHAMVFNAANNTLYFDQGPTIVAKIWPSGTKAIFTTDQNYIQFMGADASFIYWVDRVSATDSNIRKQGLIAGSIANLVSHRQKDIMAFAVGPRAVYWAEDGAGDILYAYLPNGLGTSDPRVLWRAGGSVRAIVTDDTDIYWLTSSTVQRCPLSGCDGTPDILAKALDRPWGITVDQDGVYWVTEGGSVYLIAK